MSYLLLHGKWHNDFKCSTVGAMNASVMFNVKSKTKNDCFKYVWIKSYWTIITIYLFFVFRLPDYLKNSITMVCEQTKHSRKIVKWFQFVVKFFSLSFCFLTEKASSQVKVLWYRTSTQSDAEKGTRSFIVPCWIYLVCDKDLVKTDRNIRGVANHSGVLRRILSKRIWFQV